MANWEMDIAKRSVASMTTKWDPTIYTDDIKRALIQATEKKRKQVRRISAGKLPPRSRLRIW